jgi:hypothetical protein
MLARLEESPASIVETETPLLHHALCAHIVERVCSVDDHRFYAQQIAGLEQILLEITIDHVDVLGT